MENLLSTWVSTVYGTIGIAVIKDPLKNEIALRALPVRGLDQKHDEQEIADWGGRIPISDLKKMIKMTENSEQNAA